MYKITYSSLGVIGTNCYTLINDSTGEAILVDATGDLDSLLQGITEINADLKAVLLTHAHFDHMELRKNFLRQMYILERMMKSF